MKSKKFTKNFLNKKSRTGQYKTASPKQTGISLKEENKMSNKNNQTNNNRSQNRNQNNKTTNCDDNQEKR